MTAELEEAERYGDGKSGEMEPESSGHLCLFSLGKATDKPGDINWMSLITPSAGGVGGMKRLTNTLRWSAYTGGG